MPLPTSNKLHCFKGFQRHFHQRWQHLSSPHVRALAWLLESPDLLDLDAAQWKGKIASLETEPAYIQGWLTSLDASPEELDAWLDVQPFTRLGRYAEKLLAFYLKQTGRLAMHGLQIRTSKGETIGEFDFLLKCDEALEHWEFATKFYLLNAHHAALSEAHQADYFVGPNLADTLGAKVRKILDKQLALARHPAALAQLNEPISESKAIIKGWLFYRDEDQLGSGSLGLSANHCRGFWCTLSELDKRTDEQYAILPRISWLAPLNAPVSELIQKAELQARLALKFQHDSMPVLVSVMQAQGEIALEADRGFIVPDDWQDRAGQRMNLLV